MGADCTRWIKVDFLDTDNLPYVIKMKTMSKIKTKKTKTSSNGSVKRGRKMTPYYLNVLDGLERMVKKGKRAGWSVQFKPQEGMSLARQREIIQKLIYTRQPFGLTPETVRVCQTEDDTVRVEWR